MTAKPSTTKSVDPTNGASDSDIDADRFEHLLLSKARSVDSTAELEGVSMVFLLARLAGQLFGELDSLHRPRGWSWSGFRIMLAVLVAGPLEPRQIAPLAGVTRASISAVLNTLERDGLVERRRDSEDRRVVTIVLTSQGRSHMLDAYRAQRLVEDDWAASLTNDEAQRFIELARKLLAARA